MDSSTVIQADLGPKSSDTASKPQAIAVSIDHHAITQAIRDLIRLGITHQDIQVYLGIDHATFIHALNRIHLAIH